MSLTPMPRTVEDILMDKGPDVLVAPPETTVFEAATMMDEGKVGSVIVMSERGVAGIFTERDLLHRVVARELDPASTALSEVMTAPVVTCSLGSTVDDCRALLAERRLRHLAVVEDDALVGLISVRDLLD